MGDAFLKQYAILLQKAKADIAIAIQAIDSQNKEIDNATILFHFQQAVEKLLKTLLSFYNVHFEKIHDISALIEICRENRVLLPGYIEFFASLNVFAVAGRYDIMDDSSIDPEAYRAKLMEFKNHVENIVLEQKGR
jgi:HEPN domain-containing protein